LLSSPDTSPTLSGGELVDVLVTLGSCRLAMDHHWVSDGSGWRHRITVIMESHCNGPQLSTRHDDDGWKVETSKSVNVDSLCYHGLFVHCAQFAL